MFTDVRKRLKSKNKRKIKVIGSIFPKEWNIIFQFQLQGELSQTKGIIYAHGYKIFSHNILYKHKANCTNVLKSSSRNFAYQKYQSCLLGP